MEEMLRLIAIKSRTLSTLKIRAILSKVVQIFSIDDAIGYLKKGANYETI